jgi:hypothetical protein
MDEYIGHANPMQDNNSSWPYIVEIPIEVLKAQVFAICPNANGPAEIRRPVFKFICEVKQERYSLKQQMG